MKLRKILFDAFSIDFPISGGFGASVDTPIALDENDARDYVGTEYAVLKYIAIIRGVNWKRVGQALLIHNDRYIDKIKIETVQTTEEGVITQIEDYYFDIDYFMRRREAEREAARNFDKEKTFTKILQRLEEMRHENEFNRNCVELLKAEELFNDLDLLNKFMAVIYEDFSFPLFDDMSNYAKQSIMSVLRELAPKLK